jgi:hypothetical protein
VSVANIAITVIAMAAVAVTVEFYSANCITRKTSRRRPIAGWLALNLHGAVRPILFMIVGAEALSFV